MKILLTIATTIALLGTAHAAGTLKGGSCYSVSTLPNAYGATFSCDHLGQVKSIREIYDKGFRVVNSVVVSTSEGKGYYLIIEERK